MVKKPKEAGEQREEVFRAILLASPQSRIPGVKRLGLLPVAGIRLVDLTLSSLQLSGVEVVTVYCDSETEAYLKTSQWKDSNLKLEMIVKEAALSPGDVMRDLDNRTQVSDDFLFTTVGMISSFNAKRLYTAHQERRRKSKDSIITSAFRVSSESADNIIQLTPDHQIRLFEPTSSPAIRVSRDSLKSGVELDLRTDLVHTDVVVVSPEAVLQFSDNFDYHSIEDLLRGLLLNEDILCFKLHAFILTDGDFCATIRDLASLHVVTKQIMLRWAYPLTPDCNLSQCAYLYQYGNIYTAKSCEVPLDCSLGRNSLIGEQSTLSAGVKVTESLIGASCSIAKNCIVKKSFLLDNVSLAEGCILENAVIMKGVTLGVNCVVGDGSVICSGSNLPANTTVPPECIVAPEDYAPKLLGERVAELGPDLVCVRLSDEVPTVGGAPSSASETEESASDGDEEDESDTWSEELAATIQRGYQQNIELEKVVMEANCVKHAYNIHISEFVGSITKAVFDIPFRMDKNLKPASYLAAANKVLLYSKKFILNYMGSTEGEVYCLDGVTSFFQSRPDLMPQVPTLLNHIYDQDIVTEEGISAWFAALPEGAMKKNTTPFVEWLQQSEEDESD